MPFQMANKQMTDKERLKEGGTFSHPVAVFKQEGEQQKACC